MREHRQFYIGGAWVDPAAARDCEVIDPSTEEVCAVISLGDQADTDKAVAAAKAALPDWAETPPEERIAYVEKIAEIYRRRIPEMAEVIGMEMGAPKNWALNAQAAAGIEKHRRLHRGGQEDRMVASP